MRHFSKLFCLLLAMALAGTANAQLSAGDIAIVSFDADDPDAFSFLALATIPSGTAIKFTDNGWIASTNSFRANEGVWEVTFTTEISCGTEVVVTAAGAPRMQVVAPVMLAASLVMVLTAILSLYLQPLATRQFRTIMTQVKADMIASMAQEGQFTRIDKLTLHIKARDPDGTLRGLMLHDMRDPERVSTYLAERGRIIEENGTPFLVMENGNLQRAGDTPESITMVAFNRYVFDLSQFTERQNVSEYHSRERSTFELLFPDTSEPYYQENEGRFRAELHERVSAILYPIAFAAIALATIGFARTSREGRSKLIFVAIVWIVGLRILGFAAMNLSRQEVWPVFLMYALPLSAIALALSIAFGRTRKLQDIWLRLWNRIPFAVIAQRTGLTSAGDFLRPKWQAVLRNAGLSG